MSHIWPSGIFLLFLTPWLWDGIAHLVKRALRAALRAFRARPGLVKP